ncbi:glutamine amidotransferase [Candidatus Saccharibacteria bacterium]|nr:MAG: glutamine amidotransferase [Candidatus Saccharibacteria bacterium]
MTSMRITKPILLIQSRPETAVSDSEYEATCRFGGLAPEQVKRLRAETGELEPVDLAEYSAIIMMGGPGHFAEEEQRSDEWQAFEAWLLPLLRRAIDENVPYLGVCLGLGAILTAAGKRPSFQYKEPVGPANIELLPAAMDDVLLRGIPRQFEAIVGHTEGYVDAPEEAVVLARNDSAIQMVRLGQCAYGLQFHPELDAAGVELRIHAYAHAGYFAPEQEQTLAEMLRSVQTVYPQMILKRFVELYVAKNE